MIEPTVFLKYPTNFQNLCMIYPPSIGEVVSNPYFSAFTKLLTITQEELELEHEKNKKNGMVGDQVLTPFEFLLNCAYNDEKVKEIAIMGFEFYLHEKVTFLYEDKKIIIGNLTDVIQNISSVNDLRILTEDMYFNFQNAIRESTGAKVIKPSEPENPDEDPRIKEIKRKARRRDAIKAKQANKDGIALSTILVAICCMGIGITPLNIGEMSYAAIGPITNMMQEKEKYDIDIRSLLAGADSKKVKPKYWIRNSDKD